MPKLLNVYNYPVCEKNLSQWRTKNNLLLYTCDVLLALCNLSEKKVVQRPITYLYLLSSDDVL